MWENCVYFISYNYTPIGTIIAPNELKLLGASSDFINLSKPYKLNKVTIEKETIEPYGNLFNPYDTTASYTLDLSKVKYHSVIYEDIFSIGHFNFSYNKYIKRTIERKIRVVKRKIKEMEEE